MIFTLIVGCVVGVFFERASSFIAELLSRAGIELGEDTLKLTSFALCLAAGAVALSVLGVRAYPVVLCLGAALGVARGPLLARITGGAK